MNWKFLDCFVKSPLFFHILDYDDCYLNLVFFKNIKCLVDCKVFTAKQLSVLASILVPLPYCNNNCYGAPCTLSTQFTIWQSIICKLGYQCSSTTRRSKQQELQLYNNNMRAIASEETVIILLSCPQAINSLANWSHLEFVRGCFPTNKICCLNPSKSMR